MANLNIPSSGSTVQVSIIDTTSHLLRVPSNIFMQPDLDGFNTFDCCVFAFLITHTDGSTGKARRLVFDLGIRNDWTNLPPRIVERVKSWNAEIKTEKNVSEILEGNQVDLDSVEAIIWSHAHWDHTGDPSTFPSSVDLVVGPGIKSTYQNGYPAEPSAPFLSTAYLNRTVKELSTSDFSLSFGGLQAIDYFNDGSFYLLSAPGHAPGHLNALARTTSSSGSKSSDDTFIYLGADSYHHAGELRPSSMNPLPSTVDLSSGAREKIPHLRIPTPCPAHLFTSLHPNFHASSSFFQVTTGNHSVHDDPRVAQQTISQIQVFDADPNIFVVAAHENSLFNQLEYFPRTANAWKEKGWKDKTRWTFLADLAPALARVMEREVQGEQEDR